MRMELELLRFLETTNLFKIYHVPLVETLDCQNLMNQLPEKHSLEMLSIQQSQLVLSQAAIKLVSWPSVIALKRGIDRHIMSFLISTLIYRHKPPHTSSDLTPTISP